MQVVGREQHRLNPGTPLQEVTDALEHVMARLLWRQLEGLPEVRDDPPQPGSKLCYLRRRIAEGAQQVFLRDDSRQVIDALNERDVRGRSFHFVAKAHRGEQP